MNATASFRLPDTAHALVRAAYTYWLEIHPAGHLPGRQHFDPLHIPLLLPHIWLLDVQRDAASRAVDFRYRVVGTAVDLSMGQTLTGKRMDAVIPGFSDDTRLSAPYVAAAERSQLSYRKGAPLFGHNQQYRALERLLMPLARDGRTVDMLFCITLFYGADNRLLGSKL